MRSFASHASASKKKLDPLVQAWWKAPVEESCPRDWNDQQAPKQVLMHKTHWPREV